jgi:8-oxo-dGTP pyrophosphatase MutT (NUDIX family)
MINKIIRTQSPYSMNSLKNLLEKYNPSDIYEQNHKKNMISFLNEHPNCFERSCLQGHFTGSCWLLSRDKQKALIMHHKKLNIWVQLGGHCDGDKDVLQVALKEAMEESGIHSISPLSHEIFDIDIHPIPERKNEPAHIHLDVRFLLGVDDDENFTQNDESFELKWLDIHDENFPPYLERMVKKWRSLYL